MNAGRAGSSEITGLLHAWSRGDAHAGEELLPVIYAELRRLAGRHLRGERPSATFDPTDLVHEAFLRLVDQDRASFLNRQHFFAIASRMMRRILVDRARAQRRDKRGGGASTLRIEDLPGIARQESADVLAVHEALRDLGRLDPDKALIAELRFFGGLTLREIAGAVGASPRTVDRQWRLARAWLTRWLDATGQGDE